MLGGSNWWVQTKTRILKRLAYWEGPCAHIPGAFRCIPCHAFDYSQLLTGLRMCEWKSCRQVKRCSQLYSVKDNYFTLPVLQFANSIRLCLKVLPRVKLGERSGNKDHPFVAICPGLKIWVMKNLGRGTTTIWIPLHHGLHRQPTRKGCQTGRSVMGSPNGYSHSSIRKLAVFSST